MMSVPAQSSVAKGITPNNRTLFSAAQLNFFFGIMHLHKHNGVLIAILYFPMVKNESLSGSSY